LYYQQFQQIISGHKKIKIFPDLFWNKLNN